MITQALPNMGILKADMLEQRIAIALGSYWGPLDDVIQVLSMPVFMIEQALFSMQNAKDKGQQQAKKDQMDLILEILGIVFMFVPFLDEVTPELDFLDGVGNMVSAVANVGSAIQGIISDPGSAPAQILGLLAGGGGQSEKDLEDLAAVRRGLGDDGEKLGEQFSKVDTEFQGISQKACRI